MAYDLYPAVDENYNFPPEVREALAKSVELRQVAVPMTTVDRNNLSAADKWDGRLILNTTEDRVQRYDGATATWSTLAEGIDAIIPMTEAVRNNLSGVDIFNGRLIMNTDIERIQRYDLGTDSWATLGELSSTGLPSAGSLTPSRGLSLESARADHVHPASGGVTIQTFTSSGTWIKPANMVAVEVICVGAGGGGGAGSYSTGGGGGGGGALVPGVFLAEDLGSTVTVTVGAGGAGGAYDSDSATSGGSSYFGSHLQAPGGGKGGYNQGGASSYGGGGGGDAALASYRGGVGQGGKNTTTPDAFGYLPGFGGGGGGGGSDNPVGRPGSVPVIGSVNSLITAGAGGQAGDYTGTPATAGGRPGLTPGGGGGGGASGTGGYGSSGSGASGSRGEVIVITYF